MSRLWSLLLPVPTRSSVMCLCLCHNAAIMKPSAGYVVPFIFVSCRPCGFSTFVGFAFFRPSPCESSSGTSARGLLTRWDAEGSSTVAVVSPCETWLSRLIQYSVYDLPAGGTLKRAAGSQLGNYWHCLCRCYRQVNISGECREKILGTDVMAFDIFDEARAEVLALMEVRRSFGARDQRFNHFIYACDIWRKYNSCFWTISIARRYACPSKWMCA